MLLALLTVSHAEPRHVTLACGAECRVRQLPRTDSTRVQWAFRGVDQPLHDQLEGLRTDGVQNWDAVGLGGGTWIVTAYLEDDRPLVATWRWTEDGPAVIVIDEGEPEMLVVQEAPTLEQLVAGEVPRHADTVASTSLSPLRGEALTVKLDTAVFPAAFPGWEPNIPDGQRAMLEGGSDLVAIDGYRRVLTETDDDYVRAAAFFRLGEAHRDLGLSREATHYFDRVAELDTAWPEAAVHLHRAQAALASGHPAQARALCGEVAEVRHRDAQVLECLGLVSLETADPAPAPTGRALARASSRPESLVLAAQLLQLDGRHVEAEPLLVEALVGLDDPRIAAHAWASLGDARFHLGDGEGARRAWAEVASDDELGDLVRVRKTMLVMVEEGPRSWPTHIPNLDALAELPGSAGAEAQWLLAQVDLELADFEGAARHLASILDRPDVDMTDTDLPAVLWGVIETRLGQLERSGRPLDQLAFYRDAWRSDLEPVVQDVAPLLSVASGYEDLELYDDALTVHRLVFNIRVRLDESSPADLLTLARLYAEVDRHEEALQTLAFLRKTGVPAELRGATWLLEGDVLLELERSDDAMGAWRKAALQRDSKVAATTRMALVDSAAGRCDRSVPALEDLLGQKLPVDAVEDGRVHLALARCYLDAGRAAEASVAAREAAGRSEDDLTRRYATWLAAEADGGDDELLARSLSSDDDLWAALGRERAADSAFEQGIREQKGDSP